MELKDAVGGSYTAADSYAKNGSEWFVGDVVPFENCAYIVNMNSDGTSKYYRFMRLMTAVRWDPILKVKKVVTQRDHISDEYTKPLSDTDATHYEDFPIKNIEFGYWPHKGSFFWFVKGRLYLKHDPNADMRDPCDPKTLSVETTWNQCDRSVLTDPCHRDYPLFLNSTGKRPNGSNNPTTTLMHASYAVSSNTNNNNHAVAFDTVFDSIFVVF